MPAIPNCMKKVEVNISQCEGPTLKIAVVRITKNSTPCHVRPCTKSSELEWGCNRVTIIIIQPFLLPFDSMASFPRVYHGPVAFPAILGATQTV